MADSDCGPRTRYPEHRHYGLIIFVVCLLYSLAATGAVTWNLQGRFLNVKGTPTNDIILMLHDGRQVMLLAVDGAGAVTRQAWAPAQIFNVLIEAGDGRDLVISMGNIRVEAWGEKDNDFLLALTGVDAGFAGGDNNDIVIELTGKDGHLHLGDHSDLSISNTGNDWHIGAGGPDLMYGGVGRDAYWAEGGNDLIIAGADDDSLHGDGGDDVLMAGPGQDHLFGNDGNDLLCGWLGHDVLFGGANDDELYGEQGPDDHDGGAGNNNLYGNAALGDTFVAGAINPDSLCPIRLQPEGQPGIEASIYNHGPYLLVIGNDSAETITVVNQDDGISVTVAGDRREQRLIAGAEIKNVAVIGNGGDDTVTVAGVFERIALIGESGKDNLDLSKAEAERNVVLGGDGDDVLTPGQMINLVWGGGGADTINTGPGNNYLLTDADDTVEAQAGDEVFVSYDPDSGAGVTAVERTDDRPAPGFGLRPMLLLLLFLALIIGYAAGRARSN